MLTLEDTLCFCCDVEALGMVLGHRRFKLACDFNSVSMKFNC